MKHLGLDCNKCYTHVTTNAPLVSYVRVDCGDAMYGGVPDTGQTDTAHKTSYQKSELNSHAVLLQGETFARK